MRISRSGAALTALAVAVTCLLAPDAGRALDLLTSDSFPEAVTALASLVALAISAWTVATAVLIVLGGSSRLLAATTPAFLRRALVAGAVGAMTVGPAHAGQPASSASEHSVSGLVLPDRPDAAMSGPAMRSEDPSGPESVTVRSGDTLWTIAARTLPAGAGNARIAEAARAWHLANVDVIGDDPDLILPDQLLVRPTAKDLS